MGTREVPKRFQNTRNTRETELAEEYPWRVVCTWLGTSQRMATKHYLQLADERLLSPPGGPGSSHNTWVRLSIAGQPDDTESQFSANREALRNSLSRKALLMPPEGLEPSTL